MKDLALNSNYNFFVFLLPFGDPHGEQNQLKELYFFDHFFQNFKESMKKYFFKFKLNFFILPKFCPTKKLRSSTDIFLPEPDF
jgi:hypothetical protein